VHRGRAYLGDVYGYVIADVFTDTALEGNPLAVVPDAAGLPAARMQRIARELNLSETTFVLPPRAGGDALVRIFTPVGELPFAGHPVFGTAVVLAAEHGAGWLRLETGMGTVAVNVDRSGPVARARMLQPIPVWEPYARAADLLAAVGVPASSLPVEVYRNGPRHAFIGLPDVAALSALAVDHRALAGHEDLAANCFAPTADPLVWRARMFSPAYGVTEDPGTGSAAGPLALHLGRHGLIPPGATITVRQGLEISRPSTIRATATMRGATVERVEITGSAVIVADGRLHV
jgi:trans-2,3-dihydro-3-hydroxyanthranilate isomerase